MSYEVRLTPAAERDLREVPERDRPELALHLRELASQPRPSGALKLKGWAKSYRIRVGSYRIAYEIDDRTQVVKVWQIGDRKRFYQRAERRR